MIKLKKITEKNIFYTHPQLTSIWPEKSNSLMQESIIEYFEFYEKKENLKFDLGKLYYIVEDENIVGITGLLVIHENENCVYTHDYNFNNLLNVHLRWHGVIPERRNNNIGLQALRLLAQEAQIYYPKAENFIELVPNSVNGDISKKFFEKLGFSNYGPAERYEWSTYDWQPNSMNIVDVIGLDYQVKKNKNKMI